MVFSLLKDAQKKIFNDNNNNKSFGKKSRVMYHDKEKQHHRTRKALHSLFQEKAIRRNAVLSLVILLVTIVFVTSGDAMFSAERDLNAMCSAETTGGVGTKNWSASEAFAASERIEREIRTSSGASGNSVDERKKKEVGEGFTILLNTFKRRDLLKRSLRHYAECKDSGRAKIEEIRVVWSEQVPVPSASDGRGDAKAYFLDRPNLVRYDRHVGSTSIQNRFEKIEDLKTEAVFHVDDDVRIPCGKLQKGFQEWQRNREGLVGYFGRMHKLESRNIEDGTCKMRYAWNDVELFFTSSKRYSIALTKAAFSHAKYLELYSSEHLPEGVREYIDARKNCEDIAMQMLVSSVVSEKNKRDGSKKKRGHRAAVTVSSGWMHYIAGKIDSMFVDGISSGQGHHDERSGCVTDFSRMFGGGSPLDTY